MGSTREKIRPEKLLWVYPKEATAESWPQFIPSKSVRGLVAKVDPLLSASKLHYSFIKLTEVLYRDWLPFYEKVMIAQDHDVFAHIDWFGKAEAIFDELWMIDVVTEAGLRVGSSIFSVDNEKTYTHHFKATDRMVIAGPDNTSLGILVEFLFLRFAFNAQAAKVTSGTSRNAFGYFNTVGYLSSKLRMGYYPQVATDSPWSSEFPRANPQTLTICFVRQAKETALTAVISPTLQSVPVEIKTYLDRTQIATTGLEESLFPC